MLIKMDIPTESMTSPEKVANIIRSILAAENEVDQDKEHVWALGMDAAMHIKYIELVTLGLLDRSLIHAREVYRMAIMQGVIGIIIAHNHPSGQAFASEGDKAITEKIKNAGSIVEIALFDHVIVTKKEYYSFRENGFF